MRLEVNLWYKGGLFTAKIVKVERGHARMHLGKMIGKQQASQREVLTDCVVIHDPAQTPFESTRDGDDGSPPV